MTSERSKANTEVKQPPATVKHTSKKLVVREEEEDLRKMNLSKILHTDINSYLEKDDHVKCISCQNCIKKKAKVL